MMDGHDHEDRLRRALRAEADSVVPSAEGLERIRAKIEARPARRLIAWWLPAVSMVGAFAVAIGLVLAVPGFREPIGAMLAGSDGTAEPPNASSTSLGPSLGAPVPPPVETPSPEPTETPSPAESLDPATAATCASPTPSGKEDGKDSRDRKCPEPSEDPPSDPPTSSPEPSVTPSPSPSTCTGDKCQSSNPEPDPSAQSDERTADQPATP